MWLISPSINIHIINPHGIGWHPISDWWDGHIEDIDIKTLSTIKISWKKPTQANRRHQEDLHDFNEWQWDSSMHHLLMYNSATFSWVGIPTWLRDPLVACDGLMNTTLHNWLNWTECSLIISEVLALHWWTLVELNAEWLQLMGSHQLKWCQVSRRLPISSLWSSQSVFLRLLTCPTGCSLNGCIFTQPKVFEVGHRCLCNPSTDWILLLPISNLLRWEIRCVDPDGEGWIVGVSFIMNRVHKSSHSNSHCSTKGRMRMNSSMFSGAMLQTSVINCGVWSPFLQLISKPADEFRLGWEGDRQNHWMVDWLGGERSGWLAVGTVTG